MPWGTPCRRLGRLGCWLIICLWSCCSAVETDLLSVRYVSVSLFLEQTRDPSLYSVCNKQKALPTSPCSGDADRALQCVGRRECLCRKRHRARETPKWSPPPELARTARSRCVNRLCANVFIGGIEGCRAMPRFVICISCLHRH